MKKILFLIIYCMAIISCNCYTTTSVETDYGYTSGYTNYIILNNYRYPVQYFNGIAYYRYNSVWTVVPRTYHIYHHKPYRPNIHKPIGGHHPYYRHNDVPNQKGHINRPTPNGRPSIDNRPAPNSRPSISNRPSPNRTMSRPPVNSRSSRSSSSTGYKGSSSRVSQRR